MAYTLSILRLCGAITLFVVGWWTSFAGWSFASGEHSSRRLAIGLVVSLFGLELTLLSCVITRGFRGELVFRIASYLYFLIRALLSAFVASETRDTRPFAVTFAVLCLVNIILMYLWGGVKWQAKNTAG